MSVSVFSNNIAIPSRRKMVERAVLEGIGPRPEVKLWQVSIFEAAGGTYTVTVEGPNSFRWVNDFFGPSEHSPEFIRDAIKNAVSGWA